MSVESRLTDPDTMRLASMLPSGQAGGSPVCGHWAASYHHTLSVTEANALLAVSCFGNLSDYAPHRAEHPDAEQRLKDRGLVRNFNGPNHAELHPDVAFSLSRYQ